MDNSPSPSNSGAEEEFLDLNRLVSQIWDHYKGVHPMAKYTDRASQNLDAKISLSISEARIQLLTVHHGHASILQGILPEPFRDVAFIHPSGK